MSRPPADARCFRRLSRLPVVLLLVLAAGSLAAQARHPLDPLTAEEIATAAGVLRASPQFPRGAVFSTIVLIFIISLWITVNSGIAHGDDDE